MFINLCKFLVEKWVKGTPQYKRLFLSKNQNLG
jgi:hypothetical protein